MTKDKRTPEEMTVGSEEAMLDVADIYFKAHKMAMDYLRSRQNDSQQRDEE